MSPPTKEEKEGTKEEKEGPKEEKKEEKSKKAKEKKPEKKEKSEEKEEKKEEKKEKKSKKAKEKKPEKKEKSEEKKEKKEKAEKKESKSKKKAEKKNKKEEKEEPEAEKKETPKKKGPKIDFKLFNKYDFSEVAVGDQSIADYVNLEPCVVPHSHGRHSAHRFWKRKVNLVERLANKLMVTGHQKAGKKHIWSTRQLTGKKTKILYIIEEAFDRVAKKTKKNPIQVLVDAVVNSAPRAEITTVEYGGVRHPIAVDVAPQRRLDLALSFIAKGAAVKAAKKKPELVDALVEELILASKNDTESFSVSRKNNLERQAEASK